MEARYYFYANNVRCFRHFETIRGDGLLLGQFLSSTWFNQPLDKYTAFHYSISMNQQIIINDVISVVNIKRLYQTLAVEKTDHFQMSIPMGNYYWKIDFSVYKNTDGIIYLFCPTFETNHPEHISHNSSSSSSAAL